MGLTVDIASPDAFASLIDSLSTRRPDLVSMGRRARALFEQTFNWDSLIAPILGKISSLKAKTPSAGPDLRWIKQMRPTTVAATGSEQLAPMLFGAKSWKRVITEVDVAKLESGASIVATSTCHPQPNDAGFVLRNDDPNGYAAILSGVPLPHFMEIDLGRMRAIKRASFGWYGSDRFATDYRLLTRVGLREPWETVFHVAGNLAVEAQHSFAPRWARFVRIEVDAFEGDPRLLMRSFRLIECTKNDRVRPMPINAGWTESTAAQEDSAPASAVQNTVARALRKLWQRGKRGAEV
jgi:hypothetical protein